MLKLKYRLRWAVALSRKTLLLYETLNQWICQATLWWCSMVSTLTFYRHEVDVTNMLENSWLITFPADTEETLAFNESALLLTLF